MRKLNIVFFTLALVACVASAYADPPARVARLNYASGAVSFAPAEAPDQWMGAVLNRPLTSGDRLWADQNGRAELHIGSTAIRVGPRTSVDVLNLDDQILQVRLAQGAINLRVRDLARDEVVEVATPTGAVLIRQPGSYRISADPQSDVSRVLVHFGQAEVVTPTQTVTVPSSQSAVLPANAAIAFEVAGYASMDEFDRWSAERDRREDRVTSTRYVSRDMTGYEDLDQYGSWRTLPEYGAVWVPASVAPGWAPYRNGHWVWMSPWGWTWVDDAPWGYAPSHYGRWVWLDNYWGWAPGTLARRPVYAPALVAFVGGSSFSVSVSSGPAVGWFPLGWREPYIPWYRASAAHVHNINVTNVTNVTNIYNTTNINYANRSRPQAVTIVPQQTFVSARPVAQASFTVPQNQLARAEVLHKTQPAEPTRASVASDRSGHRPPREAAAREVVAVTTPAATGAREVPAFRERAAGFARSSDTEPPVRLIRRDRAEFGASDRAQQQSLPQANRASQSDAPVSGLHGRTAPRQDAAPAPAQASPAAADGAAASTASPVPSAPPPATSTVAPMSTTAAASAPASAPRAAQITVGPPNAAGSNASPTQPAAPRSIEIAPPAQPRLGAFGARGPDDGASGARGGERREAARNANSSYVVPQPPVVERERADQRRDIDPRNDAAREGAGSRRERVQESAAIREAPIMRQAPSAPQIAPPARAAEPVPPREAPVVRQAPPGPQVAPTARAPAAPPREAPVVRQAPPPPQVVPAPRAPEAVAPREAPRPRQAPPPPQAEAPSFRAPAAAPPR